MSLIKFSNDDLKCAFDALIVKDMPYFRGKDVAVALGYKNALQAVRNSVDEDDRQNLGELSMLCGSTLSLSKNDCKMVFVNESGLYALILQSEKPEAKIFKKWVVSEVLPQLRRTGQYTINSNILALTNETSLHHRVIQFVKKYYPDAIIIPGLGENQDTAAKRIDSKRKGYQAGQPDIILAVKNAKYIGFAIELKNPRGTGVLSDNQRAYLSNLQEQNYKVLMCHDYDEIAKQVHEYMASRRFFCCLCKNNKYAHSFQTQEKLHTHIRVLHNIDPTSHEKLTRQSHIQTYTDDKMYVLVEGHMLKITHMTKWKYYLRPVRIDSKEVVDSIGTMSQLTITFSPDVLEKDATTVLKRFVDGNCDLTRFSYDDVKQGAFKLARVVGANGKVKYIYQTHTIDTTSKPPTNSL